TSRKEDRDLHYAASGGYLAMSTAAAMVEEYLRRREPKAKTLRGLPGLAEVAQEVGGQSTGLFGYENFGETMRVAFASLKGHPASTNTSILESPRLNPVMSNILYSR